MKELNLSNLANLKEYSGNDYFAMVNNRQIYSLHDITNDQEFKEEIEIYHGEKIIKINENDKNYYLVPNDNGDYVIKEKYVIKDKKIGFFSGWFPFVFSDHIEIANTYETREWAISEIKCVNKALEECGIIGNFEVFKKKQSTGGQKYERNYKNRIKQDVKRVCNPGHGLC